MFHLFFALFMAFACPAHTTKPDTTPTAQFTPEPDGGGDGGHIDPDKP